MGDPVHEGVGHDLAAAAGIAGGVRGRGGPDQRGLHGHRLRDGQDRGDDGHGVRDRADRDAPLGLCGAGPRGGGRGVDPVRGSAHRGLQPSVAPRRDPRIGRVRVRAAIRVGQVGSDDLRVDLGALLRVEVRGEPGDELGPTLVQDSGRQARRGCAAGLSSGPGRRWPTGLRARGTPAGRARPAPRRRPGRSRRARPPSPCPDRGWRGCWFSGTGVNSHRRAWSFAARNASNESLSLAAWRHRAACAAWASTNTAVTRAWAAAQAALTRSSSASTSTSPAAPASASPEAPGRSGQVAASCATHPSNWLVTSAGTMTRPVCSGPTSLADASNIYSTIPVSGSPLQGHPQTNSVEVYTQ